MPVLSSLSVPVQSANVPVLPTSAPTQSAIIIPNISCQSIPVQSTNAFSPSGFVPVLSSSCTSLQSADIPVLPTSAPI